MFRTSIAVLALTAATAVPSVALADEPDPGRYPLRAQEPSRPANLALGATGITLSVLGGGAIVGGGVTALFGASVAALAGGCTGVSTTFGGGSCGPEGGPGIIGAGLITMLVGVPLLAAGIPMAVVGMRRVQPSASQARFTSPVFVGPAPGGFALRW